MKRLYLQTQNFFPNDNDFGLTGTDSTKIVQDDLVPRARFAVFIIHQQTIKFKECKTLNSK